MSDLMPFIASQEQQGSESRKKSVGNLWQLFSMALHAWERLWHYTPGRDCGTTRLGETMAVLPWFVDSDWQIQQRLVRLQLLTKSMTGEETAQELINVLSVHYSITSDHLLGALQDRATVNNVTLRTLKVVYPNILDVGRFSHTLDLVGEKVNAPHLNEFITAWISLFSHSPKARLIWKDQTSCSTKSYTLTRWWSK